MLRRLLPVLAALVVLLGVATAAGLWWLGTDAGLRFVVARLEATLATGGNHLRLDGASGSLYRGVRIERFEWQGGGIEARGTGLVARWSLPALLRRHVLVPELAADTIAVRLPPPEKEPASPREAIAMPGSFALPVSLELQRFAIGELRLMPGAPADAPPPEEIVVSDIGAQFSYHDAVFRLAHLDAVTPYGRLGDASVEIGDAPPHPLKAELHWQGEVRGTAFDLQLDAEGDLDRLDAGVTGTVADATIRLDAKLAPLAVMPLTSAQANLANLDLRRSLASAPQTLIDAELSLAHDDAAGTWTGAVALRNADSGVLSDGKLPITALDTRLAVLNPDDPANLQVQLRDLQLTLPGAQAQSEEGRITGSIDVFPGRTLALAGTAIPEIEARLAFEAIDVAQVAGQLPPTALGGTLSLQRNDFALNLSQSEDRMRALMPASMAGAPGAAEVAVRGRLDEAALHFDEVRIRLGQTRLDASGKAGLAPPFRITMKGDARRIELGQWLPRDAAIDERWRKGRISGAWSIDGTVAPGLDAWLTLELTDSTLAGKPLAADVRTRLVLAEDWAPVRVEKATADLRLGANRVRASGALGEPSDKLALDVTVAEPELLDPRLRGRLSLTGELAGAFDRLRARLALTGERLSLTQPESTIRVGSVRIEANGPATAAVPPQAPLDVSIRLRSVQAAGRRLDALDLKANGTLAAHRFNLSAAGEGQSAKLDGDGQATLGDAPSWRARLAATTVDGAVPIRLIAPASVRLDATSADVERFNIAVAGGEASLERLSVDWGAKPSFDTRGAARDLPITRLLAIAGSDPGLDALQALRLDADWSLKGSGADDLSGNARLGLREVDGQGTAGGTPLGLGDAKGENGAQVALKNGRLEGRFDLSLPSLAFTHGLTAPDLVVDGRLRLAGAVGGTVTKPLWNATLTGEDLAILQRSVGWRLTDGVLSARFEGREFHLQTLELKAGEGSVALAGKASLLDAPRAGAAARKPDAPSTLPIDGRFELTASRFQVPLGPGQRVALSGTTVLASGADGLSLRGKLRADHGIIEIQGSSAPALPGDVKLVYQDAGGMRGGAEGGADGPSAQDNKAGEGKRKGKEKGSIRILTDLAIDLGDRLRVTGNGVAARLTGSLQVLGILPDEPKLTGVVNIVDGSYQAYGQNLRIEKGAIRFNGPIDNPALDLVANRPFLPVKVGIAVTGTALNPAIALVSTPEMSETDKLSWLVLGTDPKNAPSAAQSLALRQAAQSLLVKDDGRYKPGIAERLGLDVVNFGYGSDTGPVQGVTESRNPTGLPGGQDSSSASAAQQEVVTLGKRIGSRLFVSYEQGVRGLYNLLRIQYALSERLSVRAQSGSDNAVDLLYSYSFD